MADKKCIKLCHICGKSISLLYDRVHDTVTDEKFAIFRCDECGLGHTLPEPEDLKKYYDRTYYGNRHGFTEKYCLKRRSAIVFSTFNGLRGKRVLDIGCGDGTFIRHLKNMGCDVAGTEINPDHTLFEGLPVSESVENLFGSEPFDCITMWHTLEHMPDINKMAVCVYRLLAPGGRLIIAVPNKKSFQTRLFRSRWLHLDVPRHLYHFDNKSLQYCLETNGFAIQCLMYQELEYDLLGWTQSTLNSVFRTQNIFFDHLRGRHKHPARFADIFNILAGYILTALFIPVVVAEKILNRSGTIIAIASKISN